MEKNIEYEKIQELRNHIRISTFNVINRNINAQKYDVEYSHKLKSWAISLFLLSVGFCLKEKQNLGNSYYLIPLIPVILFWLLHSYKLYMIEEQQRKERINKLKSYINNLYKYSHNELINISQNIYSKNNIQGQKKKFDLKRFWKEKIPGIIKNTIFNLQNMLFFGGMIISWIIIIIL